MMIDTKKNNDFREVLQFIEPDTVGAEIGTWRGDTAAEFVKIGLKKPYVVDPHTLNVIPKADLNSFIRRYSKVVGSKNIEDFHVFYDQLHQNVVERFESHSEVEVLRLLSSEFFSMLDEKLDWVYIDGDHSYEGVLADLNGSFAVLKSGGVILGDDFGSKTGVEKAVKTFCKVNNLNYEIHGKRQYRIQL